MARGAQGRGARPARRGRHRGRGGGDRRPPRLAAAARRGRLRRAHVAEGVRRPGPRPARAGDLQPGDRARRRPGDHRRDRRRHARPDDHRSRNRGAEAALPRAHAPRGRGVVSALLRARRRVRSGGHPEPRRPAGRRLMEAQRAEGVDDERAVRLLRPAARAHRSRRPQAQGPDDVHRPHGRRGRHRQGSASDHRRRGVQRGLLRRRQPRRGVRRRPGQRRLGHGAHHAHVRAADDRRRQRGDGLPGRSVRPRDRRRRRGRAPTRRSASASASWPPTSWRCASPATGSSPRSSAARSPARRPAWAR